MQIVPMSPTLVSNICCVISNVICSVPCFLCKNIQLSAVGRRSHLNIFSLAFLSRRAFILLGLVEIPSNTWCIFSAGWRVGWVVKLIWIRDLMNKSASYRCLKKIPPPELFLVRFVMRKNNPGQYLVNAQLQLRFIQSAVLPRYSQFSQNSNLRDAHMCTGTVCVIYLSAMILCGNMLVYSV